MNVLSFNGMKKDLAPKSSYLIALASAGLIIIHQVSINLWLKQGEILPFIWSTSLWLIDLVIILFITRRCRYIIINPLDQQKCIMGNFFSNSHVTNENLKILTKVWGNLFSIQIEEKVFYIFSSDATVSGYKLDR